VGQHEQALTDGATIVIGRKGSFGEVHYSARPVWPIDTTYYVDASATKCDLGWLAHRLSKLGLTRLNRAVAVPGLNREDAYRQRLLLPPVDEQRRIARILDHANATRVRSARQVSLLRQFPAAAFVRMFGSPFDVDGRPALELADLSVAINDCPHSTPVWTDEGEVCLRTSNLTAGDWDWTDKRYVSPDTYRSRSARGELEPGDIVLSREGTVGVAAIVAEGMKACMGQRLVQVRPHPDKLRSDYLLRFLLFVLHPDRIGRAMVGSTAQHLNVRDLRALRVKIPPSDEQERFATLIARLRHTEHRALQRLRAVDDLSTALQQRGFAGAL
jgi:type I restriction enzyme S subunit